MISVSVIGASGRMGQLATSLIEQSELLSLHSALGSKNSLNESLGADLVVDFTNPEISPRVVDFALEHNLKLLVGTSGWTSQKIDSLSQKISGSDATVVIVPNFSIGSVLATKFASEAAKYFDQIQIIETHHPKKLDAPSGTALFTASEIASSRGGRKIENESFEGELFSGIPIKSLRIEGKHAEQEVLLSNATEQIYVRHEVSSHQAYAAGMLLSMEKTPRLRGLTVGLLALMESVV